MKLVKMYFDNMRMKYLFVSVGDFFFSRFDGSRKYGSGSEKSNEDFGEYFEFCGFGCFGCVK